MNLNNIWNNIWERDSYSDPKLRELKATVKLEKMLKIISICNDDVVVDLGCGGGYITKRLYDQKRCRVIGVDFSHEAISLASQNCIGRPIEFLENSASKIDLADKTADIIVCFGVIEHIDNFADAFHEIERILKPQGYLYITSSNKNSFMYYHRKIKEFLGIWKYGYQKNWTACNLENYLKSLNFSTINLGVETGIGDFNYITYLDKLFSHIFKNWGRYIVYAGRKNNE